MLADLVLLFAVAGCQPAVESGAGVVPRGEHEVSSERAVPCGQPGDQVIDPKRKWMEPPLDDDGAICEQGERRVRVLHRGIRPGAVPSRYKKHYADHGWDVAEASDRLVLSKEGRRVVVTWTYYADGTDAELTIDP